MPSDHIQVTPSRALIPAPVHALTARDMRNHNFNTDHHVFTSRADIRAYLPDILGRVLARLWIDTEFHSAFATDPHKTLTQHGVILPQHIVVEFQHPGTSRPRLVVFECTPHTNAKQRLFYLQLVMMAGR